MIVPHMVALGIPPGAANAIAGGVVSIVGAGTTTADATVVAATSINNLSGASNSGVRLPTLNPGDEYWFFVGGANTIKLYPPSGGTLNGAAADASISIVTLKTAVVKALTATTALVVISA